MSVFLDKLSALSPVLFLVSAFLGLITEALKAISLYCSARKYPSKNTAVSIRFGDVQKFFLFLLIFVISLILLFLIPKNDGTIVVVDTTPVPSTVPSLPIQSVEIPIEDEPVEIKQKFVWLDDLSPNIEQDGNFFQNGWEDKSPFKIDDREYTSGLGMRICGTENEVQVKSKDNPYGIDRKDCRQISIEFALRKDYSSLSFSIGADKSNLSYYGSEERNGIAQVQIIDVEKGKTLFDTGWVNYLYARFDRTIKLENVETLQIVFRTSGLLETRPGNRLQFAIVNPVLTVSES